VPDADFRLPLSEMASLDLAAAMQWNLPHRAETLADLFKKTEAFKPVHFYPVDQNLMEPLRYIIEDWAAGYLSAWPDGRTYIREPDSRDRMPSHDAGMVGSIKQSVDEIHARPQDTPRRSRFDSLTLQWGIGIVKKAGRPQGPLFG
jgi:hypothetical protein